MSSVLGLGRKWLLRYRFFRLRFISVWILLGIGFWEIGRMVGVLEITGFGDGGVCFFFRRGFWFLGDFM